MRRLCRSKVHRHLTKAFARLHRTLSRSSVCPTPSMSTWRVTSASAAARSASACCAMMDGGGSLEGKGALQPLFTFKHSTIGAMSEAEQLLLEGRPGSLPASDDEGTSGDAGAVGSALSASLAWTLLRVTGDEAMLPPVRGVPPPQLLPSWLQAPCMLLHPVLQQRRWRQISPGRRCGSPAVLTLMPWCSQ